MALRSHDETAVIFRHALTCSSATLKGLLAAKVRAHMGWYGSRFLWASSDLELLQLLLASGAEVNWRGNADGQTGLMHHRSLAITELLLAHGADAKAIDDQGRTVLHFGGAPFVLLACYQRLIKAGADAKHRDETRGATPLLAMELDGRWSDEIAALLVEHGAHPLTLSREGEDVLVRRIRRGEDVLRLVRAAGMDLSSSSHGVYLLNAALRENRDEMVLQLLAAGANPAPSVAGEDNALACYRELKRPPAGKIYAALLKAARQHKRALDRTKGVATPPDMISARKQ